VARQLVGAAGSGAEKRQFRQPQGVRLFAFALIFSVLVLGVTKLLLPAYFGPPSVSDREAALHSAFTVVGLSLEQWKAREGVYPERLDQLVSRDLEAIPTDPWDPEERPLRYVVQGAGTGPGQEAVWLYSVGPDGIDDGGRRGPEGSALGDRLYPVW